VEDVSRSAGRARRTSDSAKRTSIDIVQTAFSVGASGYIVKMDIGRELLNAVKGRSKGWEVCRAQMCGPQLLRDFGCATPTKRSRRQDLKGKGRTYRTLVATRQDSIFSRNCARYIQRFTPDEEDSPAGFQVSRRSTFCRSMQLDF